VRTAEPVGSEVEADARSTSKSTVSRTFVERTREALAELTSRRLDDVRLAVMMIDGLELKGRTNVVALGITTDGVKIPLGLWDGSTENAAVATVLLARPRRAWTGPRAGHAVRARRRQGAAQGGLRGVRRGHVQRCVRHYPDPTVMPIRVRRAGCVAEGAAVGSA
jgi:hypothetical protein